jgi:hypothetical protein
MNLNKQMIFLKRMTTLLNFTRYNIKLSSTSVINLLKLAWIVRQSKPTVSNGNGKRIIRKSCTIKTSEPRLSIFVLSSVKRGKSKYLSFANLHFDCKFTCLSNF